MSINNDSIRGEVVVFVGVWKKEGEGGGKRERDGEGGRE